MTSMPTIDFSELTTPAAHMARQITKKSGELYASKPKKASGQAQYVWRMVAFYVSPKTQHHCMPVTADFDLPAYGEDGKWSCAVAMEMAKTLDPIVDQIVNTVPVMERKGLVRWAQAFGRVG